MAPFSLAALAILACSSCGSAAASGDRCAASGEKLIAQTPTARLYRVGDPAGTREVRYFICGRSNGHRYRVDGNDPKDYVSRRIATNGSYVLFAVIGHAGEDLGTLHPTVLNVATGHKQAYNTSAEDFNTLKLTALAVNARGAAAWVYEQFPLDEDEGIRQREVQKGDADGFAVLDHGLGIEPASLTLNGTSLTWTDAGQQESATLTP
ncbi:MAG TPA: hypothetical protein VH231_01405 [Solirubrobacteraceae bacterium]|nr:hypothetical protein [Solirubrobacteraceae bacterium]